jgi:hypothetical protein
MKNDRGCFLANFKPNRGDYAADQALYTVEASHMSQMVIIYITWQGMFQNGQTLRPNAYEYVSSMNQMY